MPTFLRAVPFIFFSLFISSRGDLRFYFSCSSTFTFSFKIYKAGNFGWCNYIGCKKKDDEEEEDGKISWRSQFHFLAKVFRINIFLRSLVYGFDYETLTSPPKIDRFQNKKNIVFLTVFCAKFSPLFPFHSFSCFVASEWLSHILLAAYSFIFPFAIISLTLVASVRLKAIAVSWI